MIGRSLMGLYIVLNGLPDKKGTKWCPAAQRESVRDTIPSRNPVKYVQNFLQEVRLEIKNEPKT